VKCQHGDLYTKQEQEEKGRWASWPQQRWKVLVLDTLSQLPLIHWVSCHDATSAQHRKQNTQSRRQQDTTREGQFWHCLYYLGHNSCSYQKSVKIQWQEIQNNWSFIPKNGQN